MTDKLHFAPCKYWNPHSEIRENFVAGIRNHMGCGIGNKAQGIRNLTNDWNPAFKLHCQRLKSMQYLMRLGS